MKNAIQTEIRSKCGDIYIKIRKTYEVTLPNECDIDIPMNEAISIVELLRKDAELKKDLRVLIGNNEAKLGFVNSLKKQLEELIDQFENNVQ